MKVSDYGEVILDENDLCDMVMQGRDITTLRRATVDQAVSIESLAQLIEDPSCLLTWSFPEQSQIPLPEFDLQRQNHWFMPDRYRQLDIAEYVLSLCDTPEKLQRVGQELLLFQERNLFDLLRYLKYLVDVMEDNNLVWGVGRGSSVASYVLYLLKVHKIDSMFYDLDPTEFLR